MTTNTENGVYDYDHAVPTELDRFTEVEPGGKENPKPNFREKVIYIFKNITVEPCILLLVTASMLNNMTSQNLQLEKACRVNLNFSAEICDSLRAQDNEAHNDYERETQQLLAKALAWKTYLTATLPCVLALFVGSFCDITGYRKIFLVIPITGQVLISLNAILNVYFLYEINLEAMVFSEALIEGLTGGWCITLLTAFAYISCITSEKERTFRLGVVNFCLTLALPIGTGLSGVLLKSFGYYGVYGVSTCLHVLNSLYTIFVVKDTTRLPEQKAHDGQGRCHLFRIFFNVKNVKETICVIFRKAPNNRRLRLCVLLGVVTVIFGPMQGEIAILYMSVRYRFKWDEVQYSLFQTYNLVINSIGTTISILVLAKYLGWHDALLGIISSLSKIAASFVYGFAQVGAVFYAGPVVDIMNGTALLAMRSIMSKLVEGHELGKLSSVVGMVENLMPLLYVPMYTQVYAATMEVLPGAVFLLGALLTLPAIIVLCYLFYEHRKQLRKLKSNNIELES